jgi:hypothetical protein
VTERLQPVQDWREFEERISNLADQGWGANNLSPALWERIRTKYPSADKENALEGFLIHNVSKAIADRNVSFVWDAYEVYLDACAYNTDSFTPPQADSVGIPIAAAVHYGCGLLGLWHPLLYYQQPEYFEYGEDGWSSLTKASRKRFDYFYGNELPLRAHLASNPFLKTSILVFLETDKHDANLKKLVPPDELFFYVRRESCQALHKWLTTSDGIDGFLDGVELKDDELANNLLGNDVFKDPEWKKLIRTIKKATPSLISNRAGTKAQRAKAERAVALRMLIVAHYSALHLRIFERDDPGYENGRLDPLRDLKGILSCVVPLYTRAERNDSTEYETPDFANYIAGYAISDANGFRKAIRERTKQTKALQQAVTCLARVEQVALPRFSGASSLLTENVIRECCLVDPEVLAHFNKWGRWFRETIGASGFKSGFVDDLTKHNDKMLGASGHMLDLFERLAYHASNRHSPKGCDGNHKSSKLDFRTLFLYSEPGCGKENLAKLIHLLGQLDHGDYVDTVTWCRKCDKEANQLIAATGRKGLLIKTWLNAWNDFDKEDPKVDISFPSDVRLTMTKRPTNYYVLNCGEAKNREDLRRLLFGDFEEVKEGQEYSPEKRSGAVLAGHLTGGTVFLDEFNTLDRSLDATFLRFLDKPYRYNVTFGGSTFSPDAQLLLILASNKNKEELVGEKDFNPAVVFRATENFFRIPPLRERKEDIAIFVLHQLLDKKQREPTNEYFRCIHRVSTEGMRLICEMNWEENYRGVRAFLNILLESRDIRELREPEISFDEVVKALQKIDALRSGPSRLSD